MHRCNRAERAIRTFKDHFLSILVGVDQSFPPYLWDLLLPQAELTLNLLRQSTLNPQILAWEFFHGPFDFNKTLLAPVGCRVLIHAKPVTCQSWDFRAKDGFYIGPALDLYHCFKLVKSNTKSQVISNTVEFCHAYRSIPAPTPDNKIIHGLQVMSGALTNAPPPTSMSQVEAIANLRDLFESWCLLGPPSSGQGRILSPGHPRVSIQEPPRMAPPSFPMVVPPPWTEWTPSPRSVLSTQVPLPVHSPIQVTPRHIAFDETPPPRVATPPSSPRTVIEPRPPRALLHMSPIAHRTRACAKAPLALFTSSRPCRNGISYHIPTSKTLHVPEALSALRAFVKLSPCPPRKPMALHTSVQR
jgi:hypothetical protein